MRKIVVTTFLSLDGVMENPSWTAPYWNDQIAKFKLEELFASDALLLGRTTYEGFAAAWPERSDEAGFAERMNSLPKYVVSSTLQQAGWNNSRVLREDPFAAIAALKQSDGGDILVAGSARLARGLAARGLADVYQFLLYPLVVGKGLRLFDEDSNLKLELTESASFAGVMMLRYHPAA